MTTRKIIDVPISVPNWVRWRTTDADGCIYGWQYEPKIVGVSWMAKRGDFVFIAEDEDTPLDWRTSKVRVANGE